MLTAFTGAVTGAGIPVRFMLDAMQKGKLIAAEEDIQAIEDEVMANQAAIAEQEAQRQADLVALKQQPTQPKAAA
jgi:hypothetical protein